MENPILAPAAVLVAWSLVMLFWMAFTRLPAASKLSPKGTPAPTGLRGQDLDPQLPPNVAWKSHNYTHLMEQPTIYYAAVLILAVAGAATPALVYVAWGYTLLRILHSVWQATVNTIPIRFALFLASSICLVILAISAVLATI
ncbi:MAG: hypothetical protein RL481_1785 [Pseudomonadota bacterium]|jgi:hypothetical protein